MTSFYTEEELSGLGLRSYGKKVLISRKCSIYGANHISIGDNVRIDDFCILSGNITLGSHIHISAFVALYGANGIIFEDYTGISPRSTIFSAMDDFSGDYLIGPIHSDENTNVIGGTVTIKRYAQIGANCIVFPNLTIGEGSIIGAMSLVNHSTKPWTINMGIPINKIKLRNNGLLKLID
ncbi:MAG: acyltransferase [Muribaculaceae bacterium]|nr:acyltransferase [Muribaculaceae bacterium]